MNGGAATVPLAGLDVRDLATAQPFDLVGVDVLTDDVVTEVREADPGRQTDVPGANHRDLGHTSDS